MIKSSKSIGALLFLFLCFLTSSRYYQKIKYDRDLFNSPFIKIESKSSSCLPKNNSLIGYYKKNKVKPLIVIIDAYPNKVIYKNLTDVDSKLHSYLESISLEKIEGYSITQKTWTSLPYLLAKLKPNSGCRYPFLRGAFKPRLLLNHQFTGSDEGLCPRAYGYVSKNAFIRYRNRLRAKIDKKYGSRIQKLFDNCSIVNKEQLDILLSHLKNKNLESENRINIAHEFKFHRNVTSEDNNNRNNILRYDSQYQNGLKYLILNLKKSTSIDEIIIMNDHGPRLSNFGDPNLDFISGSLIDQNYHGIWAYRIPINKYLSNKTKYINLKELIPISKERYDDSGFGKITKRNNFKYLDDD